MEKLVFYHFFGYSRARKVSVTQNRLDVCVCVVCQNFVSRFTGFVSSISVSFRALRDKLDFFNRDFVVS